MWGTSLPDDKLAGDLGNVIGATLIGVVGPIFLQQEIWDQAIWDFCNNICQKLTYAVQQRKFYSITSSATSRTDVGSSRPSDPATLRLTMSSTLVGCWTGKSVGFAPLRIWPV